MRYKVSLTSQLHHEDESINNSMSSMTPQGSVHQLQGFMYEVGPGGGRMRGKARCQVKLPSADGGDS